MGLEALLWHRRRYLLSLIKMVSIWDAEKIKSMCVLISEQEACVPPFFHFKIKLSDSLRTSCSTALYKKKLVQTNKITFALIVDSRTYHWKQPSLPCSRYSTGWVILGGNRIFTSAICGPETDSDNWLYSNRVKITSEAKRNIFKHPKINNSYRIDMSSHQW